MRDNQVKDNLDYSLIEKVHFLVSPSTLAHHDGGTIVLLKSVEINNIVAIHAIVTINLGLKGYPHGPTTDESSSITPWPSSQSRSPCLS